MDHLKKYLVIGNKSLRGAVRPRDRGQGRPTVRMTGSAAARSALPKPAACWLKWPACGSKPSRSSAWPRRWGVRLRPPSVRERPLACEGTSLGSVKGAACRRPRAGGGVGSGALRRTRSVSGQAKGWVCRVSCRGGATGEAVDLRHQTGFLAVGFVSLDEAAVGRAVNQRQGRRHPTAESARCSSRQWRS